MDFCGAEKTGIGAQEEPDPALQRPRPLAGMRILERTQGGTSRTLCGFRNVLPGGSNIQNFPQPEPFPARGLLGTFVTEGTGLVSNPSWKTARGARKTSGRAVFQAGIFLFPLLPSFLCPTGAAAPGSTSRREKSLWKILSRQRRDFPHQALSQEG